MLRESQKKWESQFIVRNEEEGFKKQRIWGKVFGKAKFTGMLKISEEITEGMLITLRDNLWLPVLAEAAYLKLAFVSGTHIMDRYTNPFPRYS